MRRSILVTGLLVLAAGFLPGSAALAADPAAQVAAHRALEAAVARGDVKGMLGARAMFAGLAADDPKDARAHYGVALASWRATPLIMDADKAEAKRVCEAGLAAATRAMALDPRSGEAVALKAGLQGLSLSFNPGAAMVLGPEMEQAMGRAEALSPKSPRVALFKAMNTLHKPDFVGGGAEKAAPQFERALALAAAESMDDSSVLVWGHDDVHVWAGRCAEKRGRLEEAVAQYREVLAINPEHGWTRTILLPRAEKALAASSRK